jgi:hypothetical protein
MIGKLIFTPNFKVLKYPKVKNIINLPLLRLNFIPSTIVNWSSFEPLKSNSPKLSILHKKVPGFFLE